MSAPPIGLRPLLALALPSALFTILTTGYRVVDQYFAQGISVAAQAAIGASVFVLILFHACFEVFAAGAGPLIARATGAGDAAGRRAILGEALLGAAWLSALLMVLGTIGAPRIAQWLGLQGEAATQCARYLRALSLTMLPLVLTPTVDQAFLGLGNARTPMLLHGLSLLLNIVLTPWFMYTLDWGIAGAAFAANLSRAAALVIGLQRLGALTGLSWRHLRRHGQSARILRIGTPMAVGTAFFALVYWGLLKTTVSPLGPHVNAALGIGFSALETMTWPVFHGLALATASLVGRSLGAARPDLAREALHTALPIATLLGVSASLLFYWAGAPLTGWFTDDPLVHRAATEYAQILAASQFVLAWEALSEGVLAGAGDTRTVLKYSAPFNLLRIPLAWLLAFPCGYGAAGVWWAINLTTYAKTLLKGWAAWRGAWARIDP